MTGAELDGLGAQALAARLAVHGDVAAHAWSVLERMAPATRREARIAALANGTIEVRTGEVVYEIGPHYAWGRNAKAALASAPPPRAAVPHHLAVRTGPLTGPELAIVGLIVLVLLLIVAGAMPR